MEVVIITITVVANVLLGLTTYLKNPRSATNKLFALLTLILSLWSITNNFSLHASNEYWTLFWIRVVMAITSPMGPAIYLLVHTFPRHTMSMSKRAQVVIAFFTLLSAGLAVSPWMFTTVSLENGITPTPGPAIGVFAGVFFSTVIASFFTIIKKYRKATGLEKVQIKFLLLGIIATFTINGITNFVFVVLLKQSNLVWLGPTSTLILAGFIAYAILKHRFMDIGYFISRAVGYVLLLVFFGSVYLSFLYASSAFFFGTKLDLATTAVNATAGFLLAISFNRMSALVQRITARFLYKKDYDVQHVLHKLALVVGSKPSTQTMLDGVREVLVRTLSVENVSFVVLVDSVPYIYPKKSNFGDDLLKLVAKQKQSVYFDELEDVEENKALLRAYGISVLLPLVKHTEVIGCLMLSAKKSGDTYTPKDTLLLETFAPSLAVAVQNLQRSEQEFERLKIISDAKSKFITLAGHKFRTPLSSIRWNTEMLQRGELGTLPVKAQEAMKQVQESAQNLVNLVNELIEVQTLEDGTYDAKSKLSPVAPVTAVRKAVLSNQDKVEELQLEVSIESQLDTGVRVLVEPEKFRRIITEVVRNAVIYNVQNGNVTISLHSERHKVVVTVADTGRGISKGELANVFTKFYRGKEGFLADTEGVGIGLYLSKFYVESWGGSIAIESVPKAGTKVTMSFPVAK